MQSRNCVLKKTYHLFFRDWFILLNVIISGQFTSSEQHNSILNYFAAYFWDRISQRTQSPSIGFAGWLVSPRDCPVYLCPNLSVRLTVCTPMSGLLCGCWCSYVCTASTSPTKPHTLKNVFGLFKRCSSPTLHFWKLEYSLSILYYTKIRSKCGKESLLCLGNINRISSIAVNNKKKSSISL